MHVFPKDASWGEHGFTGHCEMQIRGASLHGRHLAKLRHPPRRPLNFSSSFYTDFDCVRILSRCPYMSR